MNTPFAGGYRITQEFGKRPEYYRQFGFNGHEGLDLVPLDGNRDVLCIEGGIILRDIDDPKSGAYGNHVVVWNKQLQRAWWYCHLSVNSVESRKVLKRGEKIGVMGDTGNTQGAHLHLNLRESDDQGNAIHLDNGFKGFIDPLPVVLQLNKADLPVQQTLYKGLDLSNHDSMKVCVDVWEAVQNGSYFSLDKVQDIVKVKTEELQKLVNTTRIELGIKQKTLNDLAEVLGVASDDAKIIAQVKELVEVEKRISDAQKKAEEAEKKRLEDLAKYQTPIEEMTGQLNNLFSRVRNIQDVLNEALKTKKTLDTSRSFLERIRELFKKKDL